MPASELEIERLWMADLFMLGPSFACESYLGRPSRECLKSNSGFQFCSSTHLIAPQEMLPPMPS
jgi:hypothetical protein